MREKRKIINVSVDPVILKRVDEIALGNGLTRPELIRTWIVAGLREVNEHERNKTS